MCIATLMGAEFQEPTCTQVVVAGVAACSRPREWPVTSYSLTPEQAGRECVTTLSRDIPDLPLPC